MVDPPRGDGDGDGSAPGRAGTEADADTDTMAVIAAIGHELRAPLTSMKGFSRLLLTRWDRLPDADKRDLVAQIEHDAARVTRMVTELLEISRIESGRLALRLAPVDLVELVESVLRRVELAHPDLHCVITAAAGVPRVRGDRDKLEQVLTNLFENGAKYATPHDMTCHIHARDGHVVVDVADGGPGIPAAELDLVFTRFFRREVAQPSGTGLGLWISRALVAAHAGSLVAAPNHRGGTTFSLTLPTGG
jgi:K+-sensing histidine kinase KdpD